MPKEGRDIQKMRLTIKIIKKAVLAMLIVLLAITPVADVQAATAINEEELEEVLERNEFLSNSYKQLEEKYQREKDFSRSVIYVLIFVIAILIVLLINVIALCFRKADDDFEDSFEKKPPAKKVSRPSEKPPVRTVEVKKEETKKEPVQRAEKVTPKVEKTAKKPVARNNFEVFDFNDED